MITIKTLAQIMLSFGASSNKKLQKICYYAYAWHLALYHRRLAPAYFEAWVHGPVSRELYNCYKEYGWDEIPCYQGFVCADNDTISFCKVVWELYGGYTADELESMTHQELPWQKAREGYGKFEPSDRLLNDEDIVIYFSNELQKQKYWEAFKKFKDMY